MDLRHADYSDPAFDRRLVDSSQVHAGCNARRHQV